MAYPFSDNEMIYDINKHRYILTEAGVTNGINVVLREELNIAHTANAAAEIRNFLEEVSDAVYEYVYSYCFDRAITEYMLAKVPEYREVIKSAMLKQAKYMYINGNVANEAGVDFAKGFAMSLDDLRGDRRISAYAKNELANSGLLYTGRINLKKPIRFREEY